MEKLDLTTEKNYICTIEGDDFDCEHDTVKLGLTFSEAVKVRDFLIKVIEKSTIESIKEEV